MPPPPRAHTHISSLNCKHCCVNGLFFPYALGGRCMAIDSNLVNELVKGCQKPEDLLGEGGLLSQLTKAVLERALEAEMTEHLGYSKHDPVGRNGGNSRNGKT